MEEGRKEAVCGSDPENPSHAHQRFVGVVLRPRNAGEGRKGVPRPSQASSSGVDPASPASLIHACPHGTRGIITQGLNSRDSSASEGA